jgi:hypothetical protein
MNLFLNSAVVGHVTYAQTRIVCGGSGKVYTSGSEIWLHC